MTNSFLAKRALLKILEYHSIRAKKYLDLGCGSCEPTLLIAKAVGAEEVWGVDVIEITFESVLSQLKYINFDLETLSEKRLPFNSNYFDLITAIEVIEHLTYCDDLFDEVHRILKPNSYFLITAPNLASWINRLLLLFGYQPKYTNPSKYLWVGLPKAVRQREVADVHELGHKNLLTLQGLKDILKVYGFDTVVIYGAPSIERSKIFRAIDGILSRRASFASIMVILAKKIKTRR